MKEIKAGVTFDCFEDLDASVDNMTTINGQMWKVKQSRPLNPGYKVKDPNLALKYISVIYICLLTKGQNKEGQGIRRR